MEKCDIDKCGKEFADKTALLKHKRIVHQEFGEKPILFSIWLKPAEATEWHKESKLHKMPVSKYIRKLVEDDVKGKGLGDLQNELAKKERQIEELKNEYESYKNSVPLTIEKQMKKFSNELLNLFLKSKRKPSDSKLVKITKEFIESRKTKYQKQIESMLEKDPALANKLEELRLNDPSFQHQVEWMEQEVIANHLIEAEWTSLAEEEIKRAREVMQSMNLPLVQAIKLVKKKCSPEFETFFKKEWKGLEK